MGAPRKKLPPNESSRSPCGPPSSQTTSPVSTSAAQRVFQRSGEARTDSRCAIAIIRLLEQKHAWVGVDHELFELVHAQAGVALIAANLYASQKSPSEALRGFVEKLKSREREDANG